MIPQRNISLLANRLAEEGGHRLREDVLERDYCLAWLLAGIAESEIRTILGFKGGTALKRCYFGDYRFSEDLDFTLIEPVPPEELVRRLETVYAAVARLRVSFSRLTVKIVTHTPTAIRSISDMWAPCPVGTMSRSTLRFASIWFIPSRSAPFFAATRNSRTFPKTG